MVILWVGSLVRALVDYFLLLNLFHIKGSKLFGGRWLFLLLDFLDSLDALLGTLDDLFAFAQILFGLGSFSRCLVHLSASEGHCLHLYSQFFLALPHRNLVQTLVNFPRGLVSFIRLGLGLAQGLIAVRVAVEGLDSR